MTVLIEPVEGVRSAALSLLVPAGVATDPADAIGASSVVLEMTMRGAGGRSSRDFSDELDRLGIQRDCSIGVYHARYGAAATAENLLNALPLIADIVRRPTMADKEFEPARQLALQELAGLDDDPRSLAMIALRQACWPDPLGRNTMGEASHIERLTASEIRSIFARNYVPGGAILSVAGAVEVADVIERVERYFADWEGLSPQIVDVGDAVVGRHVFVEQASEQTHIGIACDWVPERHPDYYAARLANEVLSGGTSGRLFSEIRERRGLCYSVGTSYAALRNRASLLGYAGTSNDRAQATLDAFVEELSKLAGGVTQAEVDRQKVGLLSNTVMSLESTGARATMNANDFFARGRVRAVEEIIAEIRRVTADDVNAMLSRTPIGPLTVVTVGPDRLRFNIK